jgi:protein phosphatase
LEKAVDVSWHAQLWDGFQNFLRGNGAGLYLVMALGLAALGLILLIWFRLRQALGAGLPPREDATEDFAPMSSITLVPGDLKLRVGVVSTVGNHRPHNEDNYYVPGRKSIVEGGSSDSTGEMTSTELEPSSLFIVADGMGGQQAGEEASRMAVEIIPRAIARRLGSDGDDVKNIQAVIRDSVAEANQEILGSSGAVTEYSNMGTTVVLALFRNDRVYVAGIGDSRLYRLRDGTIWQVTKDHSLADALLDAGTITKEEVPNHKFKNILYLYLGSKDARGGPEEVPVLDLRANDRFLLASDGLTGVVCDEELAEVLGSIDDPQVAAKTLKDKALAYDSKDNVTCLVIHVINGNPPQ